MKNNVFAVVCLMLAAGPVWAQKAGDVGAGVVLGNPTAVTGKAWLDGAQAVDAGLGVSTHLAVYGDYLWHSWTLLPQPAQGKLPIYFGLGAQVRAFHDAEFGIRTVAGAAYWLPRNPIELFFEIAPVFRLEPRDGVGLDVGLGARYYFKS